MLSTKFTCPHCSAFLRGSSDLIGRRVKCQKCGEKFVATDAGHSATPPLPLDAAASQSTMELAATDVAIRALPTEPAVALTVLPEPGLLAGPANIGSTAAARRPSGAPSVVLSEPLAAPRRSVLPWILAAVFALMLGGGAIGLVVALSNNQPSKEQASAATPKKDTGRGGATENDDRLPEALPDSPTGGDKNPKKDDSIIPPTTDKETVKPNPMPDLKGTETPKTPMPDPVKNPDPPAKNPVTPNDPPLGKTKPMPDPVPPVTKNPEPDKKPATGGEPPLTKSKKGDEYHTVLSGAHQKKVNDAVEKGVRFLQSQQTPAGNWPGPSHTVGFAALPALTLLECGVPPNDPVIQKAADYVRKNGANTTNTYEMSLAVLFLDKLGDKKDANKIRMLAVRLIAGQKADGGWHYDCPKLETLDYNNLVSYLHATRPSAFIVAGKNEKSLIPVSKEMVEQYQFFISIGKKDNTRPPDVDPKKKPETVLPLPGDNPKDKLAPDFKPAQKPVEAVFKSYNLKNLRPEIQKLAIVQTQPFRKVNGRKGKLPNATSDNSNSQFAMMALWVARKYNVPVEKTMALVEQRFVNSQAPDGSWGYMINGGHRNAAMHCVGLIGLAIGHGSYKESLGEAWVVADSRTVREDPQIQLALRSLEQHVGQAPDDWTKPGPQTPQGLYFLWSLERVAMLYNLKSFGTKEWYPWAAHQLIMNQAPNGQWANGNYPGSHPLADTCLALLVLKRANFVPDLTESLQDSILIRFPGPAVGKDKNGK